MQVFIPSGSPLITYRPCRSCDPANGWAANTENNNGADPGWLTRTPDAALALNFTGTGVEFNIEYSGSDGAAHWKPALKVNGTAPPSTAQVTASGVANLPLGTHEIELTLGRADNASDVSARVVGAVGTLGYAAGPESSNHTIDDTQWASGQIDLSQGWNMMETGKSNTLSESELQHEQESAGQNHNASLSWTSEVGAQTAIHFEGSAVWVFGLSGGEAGQYEVLIDNQTRGTFDASGGPRVYNQTLFQTSGLSDGAHTLTLVNRGGRLSYDYIAASKGLVPAPPPSNLTTYQVPNNEVTPPPPINAPTKRISLPPLTTPTEKPAAPAAGASKSKEDIKTIVGASVGGVVGLLVLTLIAFFMWSACRRRKAREARDTPPNAWENDKPRQRAQGKGWQFINLPDDRVGTDLGRGHGAYLDTPRRQDTHTSGSSFGSTRTTEAPVPVAHTRRSLLPFKNNLWAKKDTAEPLDDDPIPIKDIGVKERMSMSSPDPMVAALGGAPSPLTQLQRSFSNSPVTQPPQPPQNRGPGLTVNTQPKEEELADDMPKVGTYEWYNWFGLGASASGADKGPSRSRSRTSSGSGGFTNMFRRSGSTHKSSNASVAENGFGHNSNMIHLDPRAATSAAEERSPRRRFFSNHDRRDQVDSMWARYG